MHAAHDGRLPGRRSGLALTAAGLLAAAALTACRGGNPAVDGSSPVPGASTKAASTGGTGGKVSVFAIGGPTDDPFWARVKRGVDDAAKIVTERGGTVSWLGAENADNLGPDLAKLVLSAKSHGATAVVAPDWAPQSENSALKAVSSAGIPVFLYGAGGEPEAKQVGAVSYTGWAEESAGQTAGTYFAGKGVTNVLCVNTMPGTAAGQARCDGVAKGMAGKGTSEQLRLRSADLGSAPAVARVIKKALVRDRTIDGVIAMSARDADAAAAAIAGAKATARVQLGTFDLDSRQLDRIRSGKQLFCVDQQPYLQGYLAVSQAYAHQVYGLTVPRASVLTGPSVVDARNVEAMAGAVLAGIR